MLILICFLMSDLDWPMYGNGLRHLHVQEGKGAMTQAMVKWSYPTTNWIESFGPALKDINGDGKLELFFGGSDSTFYALNWDGSLLWKYKTNDVIYVSPCVADIDSDGIYEIIFSNAGDSLYVLHPDGSLLWGYNTNHPVYASSPCVVDIDGNGDIEILFGSSDSSYNSKMCVLNHDGSLLWEYAGGRGILSSPCVADINHDDSLDVIFGGLDSTLYVLNHDGSLLWSYHANREIWGSPSVADIDGDGNFEVIFADGGDITYLTPGIGRLYVLKNDGSFLWDYQLGSSCIVTWASPCIADIDKDGDLEIIIGGCDSTLRVLNHDGSLLWEYKTTSMIHRAPSVADIDGDDTLEILVPQHRDSVLYCLNHDGSLLWSIGLGIDIHNLTIGDIDNDGCLEIAVGIGMGYTLYVIDDPFGATNCSGGGFVEEEIKVKEFELDFIGRKIVFSIPECGCVDVNLYDVSGRLVRRFFNKYLERGVHKIGLNSIGAGVYFVLLKYNESVFSKKIVLFY